MVFDFDVIRDAKAETEMESMLAALRIDLPDGLSEEVSILKCVSGTTDHASTATDSMERLGDAKKKAWDELPQETKENMSQHEQQIASDFKIRNCQSHFTNVLSMNYCGGRHLPETEGQHPDKALVTHGKVEYYVQSRLCGASILIRHLEISAGRMTLGKMSDDDVTELGNDSECRRCLYRWVLQKLSSHWHLCAQNKNPTPWKSDSIPSISGGMLAGSKLLSSKGENSFYHLNESQLLEKWMKENGHVMLALFLAWKGSRFNWHVEAAPTYLLNLEWLLTFIYTLLVSVKEPNRLVIAVFNFLSCKISMAGVASRSIFFVELISVLRFAHKRLSTRWDVHAIAGAALQSMQLGLPKGDFLQRIRNLRDAAWAKEVDDWAQIQLPLVQHVHQHAEQYLPMWRFYMQNCLASCIEACQRHAQPDDNGDELMKHAYVTTDTIESAFGKLDQTNEQSQRVDIWKNFGQTLCSSSGLFLTCRERLRREVSRKKVCLKHETDKQRRQYMT